eukprot:5697312-Lingulodinium_polyedra.AAC.1
MVARLPEMPLQLCRCGPGRLVERPSGRCPGVGDPVTPRPQCGKRSDAVDAVLNCQGEPVRDRSRDCGGTARWDAGQEGLLIDA